VLLGRCLYGRQQLLRRVGVGADLDLELRQRWNVGCERVLAQHTLRLLLELRLPFLVEMVFTRTILTTSLIVGRAGDILSVRLLAVE
jgi:hypothetical protein